MMIPKLGYKDSNLEMLESESSALPFGDSPITTTSDIIHESFSECKHYFQFFQKNFYLPNLWFFSPYKRTAVLFSTV